MEEKQGGGRITEEAMQAIFGSCSDFISRRIRCGGQTLTVYALDGLVSGNAISEYVLQPLTEQQDRMSMAALYQKNLMGGIFNVVTNPCQTAAQAANLLVNGFCVVLFPGEGALACEVKTGDKRNPAAPEVEATIKGSKDAFVETVRVNTSLVRRHLRTPDLRIEETVVGRRSLTTVSVVWLEGLTNRELVQKMKQRLDGIDIDGLLTPAALEEYITGARPTAFPLLQFTERPDKFCRGILSGRVGVLADGLPVGYLAPADLECFMQSSEDYATDYVSASGLRLLRWLALLLSLLLPGIYIALSSFQQDLIPLPLLRTMIESRQKVPFSIGAEVLGLLIAFELLQQSGMHLPRAVGQSVSMIGGIVVGTAAVEAGIVAPTSLIAVSIAGICGFSLPNRDFAEAIRLWRFLLTGLGAFAGLFGVTVGTLLLVNHLAGLQCLGISYLEPFSRGEQAGILRQRMKYDKHRPQRLKPEDIRNQK